MKDIQFLISYNIVNYSTCLHVAVQINAMIFFDTPFRDWQVIPLLVVLINAFETLLNIV